MKTGSELGDNEGAGDRGRDARSAMALYVGALLTRLLAPSLTCYVH